MNWKYKDVPKNVLIKEMKRIKKQGYIEVKIDDVINLVSWYDPNSCVGNTILTNKDVEELGESIEKIHKTP